MEICKIHDCAYSSWDCPACEVQKNIEELEGRIEDLENEKSDLEKTLEDRNAKKD